MGTNRNGGLSTLFPFTPPLTFRLRPRLTTPPGYAARVPLSDNPFNRHAFETQICAIILAPTLLCISIYLTLKHVCLSLNPGLSRVRPHLYPFVFVPLDVSCLLVQAIGGALAASAGYDNLALLQHGNRAIIAGIVLQVVVLLLFGITAADYHLRLGRWIRGGEADPDAVELWADRRFRMFVYAVSGAYGGIHSGVVCSTQNRRDGWRVGEPHHAGRAVVHRPRGIVSAALLPMFPMFAGNRGERLL